MPDILGSSIKIGRPIGAPYQSGAQFFEACFLIMTVMGFKLEISLFFVPSAQPDYIKGRTYKVVK